MNRSKDAVGADAAGHHQDADSPRLNTMDHGLPAGAAHAGQGADAVAPAPPADDPEPVPPTPPEPYECCQSGCIPCVYDLYNDEMDNYREALRAWRARHGITS